MEQLVGNEEEEKSVEKKEVEKKPKHHPVLLDIIANEIGCKVCDIRDFELSVVDTQPSCFGGARDEFIFSPRLDNLLSCFTALESYFNTLDSVDQDEDVRLVSFFDHEEIGSQSYHGAGSSLMSDIIKRITLLTSDENTPKDAYDTCIAKSFIISSDMAHAVHPNYSEKHEKNHKPMLHLGPVIKFNSNQRYATTSETSLVIKEIGKRNNIPIQEVCVRNDSSCGSTIGPILSSGLGIRTVDIGNPQWSMHSIRETCGTLDVLYSTQLFTNFFTQFRSLDNSIDE